MIIAEDVKRSERTIGQKADEKATPPKPAIQFKVQVPAPYLTGHVCTEAEASILNQTLAENISNNLRDKLVTGRPAIEAKAAADGQPAVRAEAARPWTVEEAQALVDSYVTSYEPGVRGGGGGAPRITDPVEREALNIAGEQVDNFLETKGVKRKDVDFKAMRQAFFDKNRDALMKEAKRVVDARAKAIGNAESLTADLINFMPGVAPTTEGSEGEASGDESGEEAGEDATE